MTIPYRTRRALRRLASFILAFALIAVAVGGVAVVWLGRYVVYTKDGAELDFSQSSADISGEEAVPPTPRQPVAIYYNEGSAAVSSTMELQPIKGYYITVDDLYGDPSVLLTQLRSLPDNTPIMIELKDIYGNFYYRTGISGAPLADGVDFAAVAHLITELTKNHRYVIASIPAFRDRAFGLENTIYGIASSEGAYLYMDNDGCYWLNPVSNGTLGYLSQIITELKALGFDEVVFTDFSIPDSPYSTYDGDPDAAIAEAAEYCMKAYSTDNFAVSFVSDDTDFPMPETGRGRLYLRNISAHLVKKTVEQTPVENKQTQLVLLTTLLDTRFDEYSVIRPISLVY